MATDAADRVAWLLEVPAADADLLAGLRHLKNLRIAGDGSSLWIEGFDEPQLRSTAVQQLPSKRVWRRQGHLLFANLNLVPARKMPPLLWSPIARGLPLELPEWNHSHAVMDSPLEPRLVRGGREAEPVAAEVPLEQLGRFICSASAIRLRPLQWTLLLPEHALIYGTPALPVPGRSYWQDDVVLIPTGYTFEYAELRELFVARVAQTAGPGLILMRADGSWSLIPETSFGPLSIGSFRQSLLLTHTKPDGRAD